MTGAADRSRFSGEGDLALAHTMAVLSRAKRLERLDHYLKPAGQRQSILDKLKAMKARGAPMTITLGKRGV